VTPKALILHVITRLGADSGSGYAVEYAGSIAKIGAASGA
jgi:homoaconitase/3-isopropylmalate dehydratase large subunit